MNKFIKTLVLGIAAASLAVFEVSCGSSSLTPYQGHWVEVDSDATLDISGSTLTLGFGESISEKYSVSFKDGELVNPKAPDGSFGMLTSFSVRENALVAYDMILDGYSTRYRFVREEDLAAELAVVDNSENLPKTITSDEIESFSLSFFAAPDRNYGLDEGWPMGDYQWNIQRQEDGRYEMEFEVMGSSYVACQFREEVSPEQAVGLAQLVRMLDLPAHNGYSCRNNSAAPGYSIRIAYTSGEELRISAYGTPADTCVFDLPALLAYAKELGVNPN